MLGAYTYLYMDVKISANKYKEKGFFQEKTNGNREDKRMETSCVHKIQCTCISVSQMIWIPKGFRGIRCIVHVGKQLVSILFVVSNSTCFFSKVTFSYMYM